MIGTMTDKQLDKFYTKEGLAIRLIDTTYKILQIDPKEELFIEPSAGSGAFSKNMINVQAYDIKPEGEEIEKADFLTLEIEGNDYITIGNPPFGHRADLSVKFFNKSAEHSKAIAMILPSTFMKWSIQSQLNNDFKLIYTERLEEESFLFQGNGFSVRTYFMIWVRNDFKTNRNNLRILSRPPIKHVDFNIRQHNATEGSRKYVHENWKYATWRQGYHDYNNLFTKEKDYEYLQDIVNTTNKQLFYIEPLTEESENIIRTMDFNELSRRNLSTPGFGKGDFVSYYIELKNKTK